MDLGACRDWGDSDSTGPGCFVVDDGHSQILPCGTWPEVGWTPPMVSNHHALSVAAMRSSSRSASSGSSSPDATLREVDDDLDVDVATLRHQTKSSRSRTSSARAP
jgi:hypothetical protein